MRSYVCRRIDVAFYQFVEIQLYAALRITLKPLVPTFPCFSKIVVSLLEKVSKMHFLRAWILSNWVVEQLIFNSFPLQFFAAESWLWIESDGWGYHVYSGALSIHSGVIHMILHWIGRNLGGMGVPLVSYFWRWNSNVNDMLSPKIPSPSGRTVLKEKSQSSTFGPKPLKFQFLMIQRELLLWDYATWISYFTRKHFFHIFLYGLKNLLCLQLKFFLFSFLFTGYA